MASTVNDCLALYGPAKGRTIVFCETKKECNGTLPCFLSYGFKSVRTWTWWL